MDLSLDRAKEIGGKGHAYTDLDEMYEKEDFDVTYIATPHNLHKSMIKQAFEQGKHVFCEKPITVSIEDAREIQQLDQMKASCISLLTVLCISANTFRFVTGANSNAQRLRQGRRDGEFSLGNLTD